MIAEELQFITSISYFLMPLYLQPVGVIMKYQRFTPSDWQ